MLRFGVNITPWCKPDKMINEFKVEDLDHSIRCRFCAQKNHRLTKIDTDSVESSKLQSLYEDFTKLEVSCISVVLINR